jgi:hypothetical protein
MMSEDFIFALVLLVIGGGIVALGAIYALRQKTYYDAKKEKILNEIEVPFLGKIKTNTPAIALCFLGLIPGYFAYETMTERAQKFVELKGEIVMDPADIEGIDFVIVGVTSNLWSHTVSISE